MAGIQIKNVKFSKNGKEYLHNINLKLEYGKNIVIIPDTEEDYKSAQYLVRTIAGTIKPTSGLVQLELVLFHLPPLLQRNLMIYSKLYMEQHYILFS